MRRLGLILAVCLAFNGIYGAHADVGDTARAAARHTSTNISTTSNRQKSGNSSRTDNATQNVRNRASAASTRTNVVERKPVNTGARTTTGVVPRAASSNAVSSRTAANVSRSGTATTARVSRDIQTRTIARAASDTPTREDLLSRNYSKCKQVFFDCMDEFCANKDAQLKRCACSSRINEFNTVKKRLAAAEEKMLDFSQRLLTVSMDKEDAEALSVATEGEEAYFATKDTSDSKRTLDAIAKKLKTSFDSSTFDSGSNVLSWSLDIDSAFDTVDSLRGASTTAKSGTALYSAALPVCREMAAEVCAKSDISLAEGGYLALIEQDCNTVAKTYQSQADQARAKVQEGGALLDMSRLEIYQKRNSDDILTCKKKMLDMLTNSTVCGTNLEKCLDVSGRYIDPSTGEAFLDPKLIELGTLLTPPNGENQRWSTVPGNGDFVSYLNSKRKFIEPAMEQCQDIADNVWDSFIDDALSQIKLAQDKKLEAVRQSCTTLVSQCMSDATKSITNFDARALSTFGIAADITVNAMCKNVMDTCTTLLRNGSNDATEWETGVSEIQTETSYTTLMETCRQIGRACIIQVCSSTSGNFGLCESIANSTNRKTIINHTACWDEVKACIASAGTETIKKIYKMKSDLYTDDTSFYADMYESGTTSTVTATEDRTSTCIQPDSKCALSMCSDDCGASGTVTDCRICRLAERLWGNCEASPTTQLIVGTYHNQIKKQKSDDEDTLLYWFAKNTGTENAKDSCRDTTCGIGYIPYASQDSNGNDIITCKTQDDINNMCYTDYSSNNLNSCLLTIRPLLSDKCQCCLSGTDTHGNCCEIQPNASVSGVSFCAPSTDSSTYQIVATSENNLHILLCVGTMDEEANTPTCNGKLVLIDLDTGHYKSPTSNFITEAYMSSTGQCTWNGTSWNGCTQPDAWSVVYSD